MSFVLLCSFIGGYTDCKNTHSMDNIKPER